MSFKYRRKLIYPAVYKIMSITASNKARAFSNPNDILMN